MKDATSSVLHGATRLAAVCVDAYNAELRAGKGFIGDRASSRAFREILAAVGDSATRHFTSAPSSADVRHCRMPQHGHLGGRRAPQLVQAPENFPPAESIRVSDCRVFYVRAGVE